MTDSGTGVIGREDELAAVGSFTAEVSVPHALVLEGAPGIGKTTLWEAGVAAALSAGHPVPAGRGRGPAVVCRRRGPAR